MDITIVKNIGPALSNRICLIFEIIIWWCLVLCNKKQFFAIVIELQNDLLLKQQFA